MLMKFLGEVSQWAEEHPDVLGLALVGSHARNAGRPDSDIDLAVLCADPSSLNSDHGWTARFGEVREIGIEYYGAVCSLRVYYKKGLEVEFGIADSTWARVPLDPGTLKVILDGIRILYDPKGILSKAKDAAA